MADRSTKGEMASLGEGNKESVFKIEREKLFSPFLLVGFNKVGTGPNFIALLNGKQFFVLTVADNFAQRVCERILQVSRTIGRPYCAFTMDLHCDVICLRAVSTGRLACLFVCLRLALL